MNLSRNIGVIFLILSFNPFVLCQVTDSHDGDFVVVTGTTTYESLPFIETFSDESGQLNNGQRLFNTWVTAKWNGTNSTSDDYNCLDGSCSNTDTYVSFLTPPDSFSLNNQSNVKVWEYYSSAHGGWSQAPVARFYYSDPMDYSMSLYSPLINITDYSDISVSFDMHLWAWTETEEDEFLDIEYSTGSGWVTAMVHLADAPTAESIPWGPNGFFVRGVRDLDTLQLRFRANGYDSYNLMGWYIDNVKVKAAPMLNIVNIYGPAGNPGGAKIGDDVTISMISTTDLMDPPTVIMNGEFVTTVGSGSNFSATKTITATDSEGPVMFSIDFMSADTIPGQTVRESTDDSKVIIDNFGPGDYDANDILPVGGNVIDQIWNSTNTSLNVTLTLPLDSAVSDFDILNGWSRDYNNEDGSVTPLGPGGLSQLHHRLLNAMTLEVWVMVHAVDTYDGMVVYGEAVNANESGYGFVFFNGWRFFLVTDGMSENSWQSNPATSLQNNVWTHLAGTYDGTMVKLYKDGVIADSLARSGNINYDHADITELLVGKFKDLQAGDGGFNYFDGQVSEVRVWNYARSQTEISGFRSWALNGNEAGLVGYWKMAEGSGTVLADETDNSNGTCPASGWVNDAPTTLIDSALLVPDYDTEALVGAKIKLQASINGGNYIDFGEDNIITLSDLPPNQMTANASADYLESISGFAEDTVLTLGTKLIDIAGNETIGTPSTDTLLVKQDLDDPDPISISSNNGDPAYAVIGNTVTVSFTTTEAVNTPTVTIQGNNATVTNEGGNLYNAAYEFSGSETNGPVTFSIMYTDLFGNPDTVTAVTDGSAVIYDDVDPSVIVTTYSSNDNTGYAKLNDTVYVRINSSESLRSAAVSALILGRIATTITSSNNDSIFIAQIFVVDTDEEGEISFTFTYSDYAGNQDTRNTTDDGSKVICDMTPPVDYTTGLVVSNGGTVALRFWNSTNTGLNVTIPIDDDATLVEGIAHPYVKFNAGSSRELSPPTYNIQTNHLGMDYTITFPDSVFENLTGFAQNANVEFFSKIWDAPYNTTTGDNSASILKIDQEPPDLIGKMIYSTNDDQTRAILGDTVYVQFSGETEGIDTVAGNIGSQAFDGYDYVNGFTSRVWRRMTGAEAEGVLPFSITAGDTARNMSQIYTEVDPGGGSVDFSAAGPEILLAKIRSNNSYGDTLAMAGDSIIVEIRTDMPISLNSALISGQTAVAESPSSNRYIYNIIAASDDQDGIVQFTIDYNDLNGNPYSNITTTTDDSYVRFDSTDPVFPMVSISSTGVDSTLAGENDAINLTFRIHESVSDSSVIILNNPANSITALNNNYYRATYVITGSESEGRVRFNISATDLVGNSASIDSTSNNSYVVFDQTPPSNFTVGQVIADGGMVVAGYWNSTNQNILVTVPLDNDSSLIDGAVQVLVSFDGGDTLEVGDPFTIDSVNTNETVTISRVDFVNSQDFAQGATALFTARINDFAGYTRIGTPSSNQLQIDQTGPSIDSIAINTDNPYNTQGATWNDYVFIYFRVLEEIITPLVLIEGDTAEVIEVDINVWKATKQMDSTDVEGYVNFSFTPRDLAGNPGGSNTQTTDGTRVIYDYSRPFMNNINEGGVTDKDYTPSEDSLRLVMDGGDLVSGIKYYYFALSPDSAPNVSTAPVFWDENYNYTDEVGDTLIEEGLDLIAGNTYYAKAYARDAAGNASDIIVGDGITVDIIAPFPGTIEDGFDISNDSLDWTIDSTRLDVIWDGFSDNSSSDPPKIGIIGSYELSIKDEQDTVMVLDWFTVDTLADSATITGLALQKNMEYFIAIRAVDMAGNKSVSVETDGIQFDNQPAKLDTVMPSLNTYLDVSSLETIEFKFNKKIKPSYKFTLNNIGPDTISYTKNLIHNDSTVSIALEDTLLTADTLYFNFDSVTSENRLTMTETIILYSMLWGDLDSNRVLDVADVVRFNARWPDIDLAPVEHGPPHYAPNLDGEANLRDLSIFSRMWNWYYKTYIPTLLMTSNNIIDVAATYSGGQLRIQLPENTSAGQIIFTDLNYDVINVFGASSSPQNFVLVNEDSLIGLKAYTFATLGETLDSVFVIDMVLDTETDYNQDIQVRFHDKEGKGILAGTALLKITPVPSRYALGQNYPNPFNPTTNIRFELPEDSHTRIAIYDLLGREIIQLTNGPLHAGYHQVVWQGRGTLGNAVPSGMYFYRMEASGFSSTRKMIFLK